MTTERGTERGFTLIELLVVLSIVGILVALVLPGLNKAKAQPLSTSCRNHLRQMGIGLQLYLHDSRSGYPPFCGGSDRTTLYWWAKLLPYYPLKWTNPLYHCPGYKGVIARESPPHAPFGSYAYNARGIRQPIVGYSIPARGIQIRFPYKSFGLGERWGELPPRRPVLEAEIRVPSDMLAMTDSRFHSAQVNGEPGGECDMTSGWLKRWLELLDSPKRRPSAGDEYALGARHGKNYNQLFCDGHVTATDPWKLFNPTNTAAMWNSDHEPHPELWVPE